MRYFHLTQNYMGVPMMDYLSFFVLSPNVLWSLDDTKVYGPPIHGSFIWSETNKTRSYQLDVWIDLRSVDWPESFEPFVWTSVLRTFCFELSPSNLFCGPESFEPFLFGPVSFEPFVLTWVLRAFFCGPESFEPFVLNWVLRAFCFNQSPSSHFWT